jgi:hypothetical protein
MTNKMPPTDPKKSIADWERFGKDPNRAKRRAIIESRNDIKRRKEPASSK